MPGIGVDWYLSQTFFVLINFKSWLTSLWVPSVCVSYRTQGRDKTIGIFPGLSKEAFVRNSSTSWISYPKLEVDFVHLGRARRSLLLLPSLAVDVELVGDTLLFSSYLLSVPDSFFGSSVLPDTAVVVFCRPFKSFCLQWKLEFFRRLLVLRRVLFRLSWLEVFPFPLLDIMGMSFFRAQVREILGFDQRLEGFWPISTREDALLSAK